MPVTLTQAELKEMTAGFAKVIHAKVRGLPVLQSVLFRVTTAGTAEAVATNLDETLSYRLDVAEPGAGGDAFLMPYGELRLLAGSLGKGDRVTLQPEGEEAVRLQVQLGAAPVPRMISTLPAKEFACVPNRLPEPMPPADDVLRAYRTVLPFAAGDPTRQAISAVFCHREDRAVVATDGKRLTLLRLKGFPFAGDVLLPKSRLLARGMFEGDGCEIGLRRRAGPRSPGTPWTG